MGRPVKEIEGEAFTSAYNRYKTREINKTQLAKVLNVSRPTLDKILKSKGLK